MVMHAWPPHRDCPHRDTIEHRSALCYVLFLGFDRSDKYQTKWVGLILISEVNNDPNFDEDAEKAINPV